MPAKRTPQPVSGTALFRYSVVSEVLLRMARGQDRAHAVQEAAEQHYIGIDGQPVTVGRRSIYRWLAAYQQHGITGLENQPRTTHSDGVLQPDLVAFLVQLKKEDPRASVPQLLRCAVAAGLLANADDVDRITVWRALKRRDIDTTRRKRTPEQRRFAHAHRLQLVLCDGKHFRAGRAKNKRVALFFIDDATRYVPEVVVGTSESCELFLRGLYRLLRAVGRIDGIYLDHGSGFTAHDARAVIANLGFAHILGLEGYPQARGKIERFNKTVGADLLRHLAADDVDADCRALELRISEYLRADYNVRGHEGLEAGQTPRSRFLSDERPLVPYTDDALLRSHFFVDERRRVTNDHVVSIGGRQYEVPLGLAKQHITVQRDVFDAHHLLLSHNDRTVRLAEVDLVANARSRRARPAPEPPAAPVANSAAHKGLERLSPITDADGGFVAVEEDEPWTTMPTSG